MKIVITITIFILVARLAWSEERRYLAQAATGLREGGWGPTLDLDLADGTVTSAAGTRKERRKGLKEARKSGGRGRKKTVKTLRERYLDALQAWGRRGTGVDELPTVS